jgi:hypothetical protein
MCNGLRIILTNHTTTQDLAMGVCQFVKQNTGVLILKAGWIDECIRLQAMAPTSLFKLLI